MGKVRIYEIAKELDIDSKLIIEKLKDMNVDVKNHMSSISEEVTDKLKASLTKKAADKPKPQSKPPVQEKQEKQQKPNKPERNGEKNERQEKRFDQPRNNNNREQGKPNNQQKKPMTNQNNNQTYNLFPIFSTSFHIPHHPLFLILLLYSP